METKAKTSGQTQCKSISAESFTDHDLKLRRDIGGSVRVPSYKLEEGGGFKNIYRARDLRFDKSPLRRFPFLHAKLALSNFGLLRNQSTFPPVKV